VQGPAPERLIENGIPTEALVAHVLIAKYADHTPLYRQAQIYARQGITLDRSTLLRAALRGSMPTSCHQAASLPARWTNR
jgi:transposase